MILVADSGSTKTDWSIIAKDGSVVCMQTAGLNPCLQTEDYILTEIKTNICKKTDADILEIYYYGAGVTAEKQSFMISILGKAFPSAKIIMAHSDLLGSARSVCGNEAGIACILGTGSNSCLYDGRDIVDVVNCGGYILGDEGSGAVMGRNLLNAFLKRELSQQIHKDLAENYNLSYAYIVEKVYKKPMPNHWMANFAKYMAQNKDTPCIRKIIFESLEAFFTKNIEKYDDYKNLSVNFIGSIAYYFESFLREIAGSRGIAIGKIIKAPSAQLVEYHKNKITV